MVKLIDEQLFAQLDKDARAAARKRSHYNLHPVLDDPVQRLCISLQPGTYVRPHRHPEDYKWEMMLILTGRIRMLLFDDRGSVTDIVELSETGNTRAIEIPPNTWHTLLPVEQAAIFLEIKQGPYIPTDASNFATWAPEENANGVDEFLDWCSSAKIGDRYLR